eukprot:gene11337-biopygen5917
MAAPLCSLACIYCIAPWSMAASLCSPACIYCVAPWSMAASLCSLARIGCIAPWRAVCNFERSFGCIPASLFGEQYVNSVLCRSPASFRAEYNLHRSCEAER